MKDFHLPLLLNGALASALFGIWMKSAEAGFFMFCTQAFVLGLVKYMKDEL